MRTARRYLASEIYRSSAVVLLALLGLFTFFALIEELDNVGSKFSLASLFYIQALELPTRLYDLLPIGLLIGAILALASLAQRNELVILRASGVSGMRMMLMLWTVTLPLVAGAFVLSEYVTPMAEVKSSEQGMALLGRSGGGRLDSGYWFKENKPDNGMRIINIASLQGNGNVADVSIYDFIDGQRLSTVAQAPTGVFNGNELVLTDVTETHLSEHSHQALAQLQAPDQPLVRIEKRPELVLQTTLTPDRLIARVVTPERMSILDLKDYIDYLQANKLQTKRQVVALWRKVAYPFTLLVMITIAAPIGFMQTRHGGVGTKVFTGILLGVGFFMINQLALNVAMLSDLAPWVTALLPNLMAMALALGGLILMENRHNLRRRHSSVSN
ncbi:LPS export ABC transporter permease LptG [Alcaligenes sp. SDU_A2]|uniref:LPS export ABC transporter permease LptG n=1 Tax=Alcaligenes sp. SDU_A2 TaxID=3136634 RepID=UPI002B919746|nr:LPS export ABC transporter permease LptG [Alcaligenes sp.]HRL28035.1 LPS export ABC transporter permease LptG [Alcaligenes sp.]